MASIFLSHSSVDKEFVRELHKYLEDHGIKSWIDEAEIKIGDSLLKKISEGIKKAEYVAIILSPNSINSPWVETELEIAMNQEINERKIKVLPILIEHCEIPEFLKHKKYGDFRTPSKVISGLKELLEILEEKNSIIKKEILENSKKEDGSGKKIEVGKFKEIYLDAIRNRAYGGMGMSETNAMKFALKNM